MKKQDMYKVLQKGSLMVEALALLGLITMVTPVMYKKAAERTTELQDINIATQMRTLNEALDNYVRNNYEKLKETVAEDAYKTFKVTADPSSDEGKVIADIKKYLPAGFDISQSRYFDASNLQFSVNRVDDTDATGQARTVYTSAVLAPALNEIKPSRASKIASMVGINGGTIKGTKFEGAQGAWSADPGTWFGVTPTNLKMGSLMTISNEAIAEGSQADTSKLLFRQNDGDETKSTMKNDLLLGNNNITHIKALFGEGGTLMIGENDTNGKLLVNGLATLANGLKVSAGGATIADGLTVSSGETSVGTLHAGVTDVDSLTVAGHAKMGSAEVVGDLSAGDTTLASLGVTGNTTLGELVAGNTTVNGTLKVTGKTTLGELEAGATTLASLEVTGDATVDGTLGAKKLHAKEELTVGGDDPSNAEYMKVNSNSFYVKSSNNYYSINADSNNATVDITGGAMTMHLGQEHDFKVSNFGDTHVLEMGRGKANFYTNMGTKTGFESTSGTGGVGDNKEAKIFVGDSNYVSVDNTTAKMATSKGSVGIDSEGIKGTVGEENRLLIKSDESTLSSAGSKSSLSLTNNGFSLVNKEGEAETSFVKTDDDVLGIKSDNIIVDGNGMVLGDEGLSSAGRGSFSEDVGLWSADEDNNANNRVVISRKGYIDLVPNNSADREHGFIRARRLVSDVVYPGAEFDGATYDGDDTPGGLKGFQYYEVNPAYTSVMNDIKLASRGGARLSDILPDYVIKGIYVADNTYHAGIAEDGDALAWDSIPIVNGAPKDGVIKDEASGQSAKTNCKKLVNGKYEVYDGCQIYTCESSNCVASPWMGFIPRPQCPPGYQAVVTSNPIRWRMSEVYYVNEGTDWDREKIQKNEDHAQEKFVQVIGDLNSIPDGDGQDDEGARFNDYFTKNTNPLAHIGSESPPYRKSSEVGTSGNHSHDLPVTIQTNTWLNSSVSPHLTADGSDIDGWHMLMGFLYTPKDYSSLLQDMGYGVQDSDNIFWNIFPVYAHEMASIVTTYCSFNRRSATVNVNGDVTYDWKWDADENYSPVLNYDQLDPNFYRDPTSYDKRVAHDSEDDTRTLEWSKTVNDPNLPYNDAW